MLEAAVGWQPPHPGADELRRLFPAEIPLPADETEFQLGLSLGGTVSAGAYTAGVVDFLIEALDAWARAREDGDPLAPPNRVVLKLITGASGGGVNGAIATRALPYAFPPVTATMSEAEAATNPFYDVWVNRLDIKGMLETGDLAGGAMPRRPARQPRHAKNPALARRYPDPVRDPDQSARYAVPDRLQGHPTG